jgi:hypothetical protein
LIEAIRVINLIFVTMVSNWMNRGTFEASDSTAREHKPLSQQLLVALVKSLIFAAPGLESLPSHGNSRNCQDPPRRQTNVHPSVEMPKISECLCSFVAPSRMGRFD